MNEYTALCAKRQVLVIDDEESVRTVLRRYLTRRGWEVTEAVDGAQARALVEQTKDGKRPFDLIICDVRMPMLSGPEFFDWIKERRPELAHRLLFASGDVFDPAVAGFLQECGAPTIEKPFELTELSRVISLFDSPRERAA